MLRPARLLPMLALTLGLAATRVPRSLADEHWAYAKPTRQPAPKVTGEQWPRNWIDHFVLARLEAEGLDPSSEADPVTLVRRLHFDLIGLPPEPETVDKFRAAPGPAAYEKIVDELLASDRYGERMAMYWLDLVRYADTVGYHGDQEHNISPYRDYVIDAFNDNLPFDRFTHEQLAGDLLPDAGVDQRIASGYNRLLQTSHEGGVQEKEYLAIYGADRVRNLSSVWMGTTLGCCQCHDHKYDPFTTKDFYSIIAFFADLDEAQHLRKGSDTSPTVRAPEIKVLTKRERQRVAELEGRIAQGQRELDELGPEHAGDAAAIKKSIEKATAQRDTIEAAARLTMVSVAIQPRTIRILPRGNWLDESGPVVQPAVPGYFGKLDTGDRRPTRLDLADWLIDTKNGIGHLTARVIVNRFWYLLLGRGIVKSLDDFGKPSEPPTHPELLDNLAIEFIESGWDVKHMIKLLIMSSAYRQSSHARPELAARDPDNRLFARQARYRLPAEVVRDNALAVSGLLVLDYGGPSAHPYQPAGYYQHLNFPKRKYQPDGERRQWRRGVYMHWQRQFLHPMLLAFDAPTREECTAGRPRSNTPAAALTLLNDPMFVEAARALAARMLHEAGPATGARLDFLFRQALSRTPDGHERELLAGLLASSTEFYSGDQQAAEALVHTGIAPVPDDTNPAELAAWTTVARAILNLHETVTRN